MFLRLVSLLSSILPADPVAHVIRNASLQGASYIEAHGSLIHLFTYTFLPYFSVAQDCFDSRLRAGKCLVLAGCPAIIEEFYRETNSASNNADFQAYVSQSICGFDGSDFQVSFMAASICKL